jgi:hypothetical protein
MKKVLVMKYSSNTPHPLDPHFVERVWKYPMARFPGDVMGWEHGKMFAKMLSDRGEL